MRTWNQISGRKDRFAQEMKKLSSFHIPIDVTFVFFFFFSFRFLAAEKRSPFLPHRFESHESSSNDTCVNCCCGCNWLPPVVAPAVPVLESVWQSDGVLRLIELPIYFVENHAVKILNIGMKLTNFQDKTHWGKDIFLFFGVKYRCVCACVMCVYVGEGVFVWCVWPKSNLCVPLLTFECKCEQIFRKKITCVKSLGVYLQYKSDNGKEK